jgi:hypothetical protein
MIVHHLRSRGFRCAYMGHAGLAGSLNRTHTSAVVHARIPCPVTLPQIFFIESR